MSLMCHRLGMGGVIKAIYLKTGSPVRKGQTILKLDDVLARQGLVGAQQQAGVLKARLEQAQTIYERHQNLWKQNIGAEINVINAKAEVDALKPVKSCRSTGPGSAGTT